MVVIYVRLLRSLSKFVLHPLIHTSLGFTLAQDMAHCQRMKENPSRPVSRLGMESARASMNTAPEMRLNHLRRTRETAMLALVFEK